VFKLRSRGNPARNRTPQATREDFTTMPGSREPVRNNG
jgi:hypothetical protein